MGLRLIGVRLAGPRAIPRHVRWVVLTLVRHGFEAHVVGGAVRDLLLDRRPPDWDIATSAEPRYVLSVFPRAIPTGVKHGTVTVLCPAPEGSPPPEVDVTTYRAEGPYSDLRRPDSVRFDVCLKEDLGRRDFTVNALALSLRGDVTDPFGGRRDLARRLIRCVGDPEQRFAEDALRMMRAVRLCADLGFDLEGSTARAIRKNSGHLARISVERVREELDRCLIGPAPDRALELLRALGLLEHVIPELLEGVGFAQNEHHTYTVWEHVRATATHVPAELPLRLAAVLHDVAKPRTLTVGNGRRHFLGHEKVGAEMAAIILGRLRYDRATTDRVVHLIRHHMALQWQPEMKDASVRRLINRVGPESIPDLIALRRADRRAAGDKESPGGLGIATLFVRIERIMRGDQAFAVADLAISGEDVIRVARLPAGPQVGLILRRLLEEVLEDPSLNEKARLEERVREMLRPATRR